MSSIASRTVIALVVMAGVAMPAMAQDPALSSLPTSLSAEPEEAVLLAPQDGQVKQHQFSLIGSVEWWRAEMDVDSFSPGPDPTSDTFVLHSATIIQGDYKNHSIDNITLGGHLGVGIEQVALDVDFIGGGTFDAVLDQGFIFELGGDFRYQFAGTAWDIGGDILLRIGDHDGDAGATGVDYEYQYIRITAEGGYQVSPNVRPYVKIRLNMYEGEADYGPPGGPFSFDTEMEETIGISPGVDLTSGPILGGFEIMFLDVEDFGFQASIGWMF